MEDVILTRGQVERTLAQQIQALYKDKLGHRPEKATCQFFDEKLAITLEKTTMPAEQLLLDSDRQTEAVQFRSQLDEALKPLLISLIQEVGHVLVKTLLSKTDFAGDVCGMIAVLEAPPHVRDPLSIPKVKRDRIAEPQAGLANHEPVDRQPADNAPLASP